MEDLREALKFVTDLAKAAEKPNITEIADRAYTDKELKPVREPRPDTIAVTTLKGFLDLLAARVEKFIPEAAIIHIVDHATVELKSTTSDKWGRRQVFVAAEPPEVKGFTFDQYYDHESLTLALHINFVPNQDIAYLLRVASTIETVRTSEESGAAQTVALRTGPTQMEVIELKPRLSLAPFRTFRDVEQPTSDFFLRVKQEGKSPTLALFEADGGKWKIDAIANIRAYLAAGLAGASGIENIPIVS